MMVEHSYLSISNPSESIFRDRGSKFMAFAFPVKTEDEIKNHLQALRRSHPQANHHCYAWRLGVNKQHYRSNDDGEPAGSAGKPILGQLQSKNLSNVLVVVVRYFGGTLLGVSGLINAYKLAAIQVLDNTSTVIVFIWLRYTISFPAHLTSDVMRLLKHHDCKLEEQTYHQVMQLTFSIKKQHEIVFLQQQQQLFETQLQFIETL